MLYPVVVLYTLYMQRTKVLTLDCQLRTVLKVLFQCAVHIPIYPNNVLPFRIDWYAKQLELEQVIYSRLKGIFNSNLSEQIYESLISRLGRRVWWLWLAVKLNSGWKFELVDMLCVS